MMRDALIVDDSSSMRQMVKFTLSESGFNVFEAVNGKDGIEKLNNLENCKIIVSDVNMPEMNGIDFVKNIRSGSKHKFIPIVILTTESEDSIKKEGLKAGASAWIVKPFTPEDLNNIVDKLLIN